MYFSNNEDREKYIAEEVKIHRDAAACLPVLRKVATAFDGKVYNCRLQKALHEAAPEGSPKMYTETGYRDQVIIYIYNKGHQLTIAELSREDMKDGKRINAEALIESARKHRESHLKTAYELEQAAASAVQTKAMIDGLKEQIRGIMKKIPYTIRDAYNIDGNITCY